MTLAESRSRLGWRVLDETALQDYRIGAEFEIIECGRCNKWQTFSCTRTVSYLLAILLNWNRTISRWLRAPLDYTSVFIARNSVGGLSGERVFTPEDVFAGRVIGERVLVFDFDNYYLGGVLAEHLATTGHSAVYATPAGQASAWTIMTNELPFVYQALMRCNVEILTTMNLAAFDGTEATLTNLHTGDPRNLHVDAVVIVGFRAANTDLYHALTDKGAVHSEAFRDTRIQLVGDALAPGAIAHAVHSGHVFARSLLRVIQTITFGIVIVSGTRLNR